jgi:hypothetical protein
VRLAICCCIIALYLVWVGSATGADPYNPQPADGDLILPMPNGVSMVFRPVFIGEGEAPFALKKVRLGDPLEGFREYETNVVLGGAFKAEHQGKRDWLYYLGTYEVMEDQYYALLEPSKVSKKEGQLPINNISWFEAQEFIHKYNLWLFANAKEKLPKSGEATGYVRLPTESEWEFAARGGAEVPGEQFTKKIPYTEALNRHEWFAGPTSSHNKIQKAGQLKPNVLGLYDMLGNVSEMTASYYQIEYYQGRVGGFVARGGNYTTPGDKLRSSQRYEQPFYNAELKPQRSATLGLRLALSAIVFTDRQASQEIESAWQAYRASPLGTTSPAPQSIAPPNVQVGVQLADAVKIVELLLKDPSLSQDNRRNIETLKASFANIESARKDAVVDTVYNIVELATIRAQYVSQSLKALQEKLAISQSMKGEIRQTYQHTIDDLAQEIEKVLHLYITNMQDLDKYDKEFIEKAMQKYSKQSSDLDMLRVLELAVRKHFSQYSKAKRADEQQWRADLALLNLPL